MKVLVPGAVDRSVAAKPGRFQKWLDASVKRLVECMAPTGITVNSRIVDFEIFCKPVMISGVP
ncbi:MAG: hypothetical protein WC362_02440 [Methanoregula sp.]